jgi:hypothetical protein
MTDVVEQGSGNGLSRRQMIKASAVAGAAAWTAPVIIDSLASPAAAGSVCQPPGTINTSGAGAIYQINGTGTYYFSWIPNGQTTCAASCTVPNDSTVTNVNPCGSGSISITNGVVTWSPGPLTCQSSPCYFTATASGINLTAAGVSAGVTVTVWLLHNGSFSSFGCTAYGSPAHWAFACGSSSESCGNTNNCL